MYVKEIYIDYIENRDRFSIIQYTLSPILYAEKYDMKSDTEFLTSYVSIVLLPPRRIKFHSKVPSEIPGRV